MTASANVAASAAPRPHDPERDVQVCLTWPVCLCSGAEYDCDCSKAPGHCPDCLAPLVWIDCDTSARVGGPAL